MPVIKIDATAAAATHCVYVYARRPVCVCGATRRRPVPLEWKPLPWMRPMCRRVPQGRRQSEDGRNPDELVQARNAVTPEDFSMLARTRRSIRVFRHAPVPHEALLAALDSARYAPTGKNRQDVEWIAVEGEDKLKAFVTLVIDAMRAIPGTERLVAAFEQGQDPILREAPCVVFAHASADYDLSAADCALAVGYF